MKIFNINILTDNGLQKEFEKIRLQEMELEEKKQKQRKKQEEWDLLVKSFYEKGYILDTEFDWSLEGGGWYFTVANKNNLGSYIKKRNKSDLKELLLNL